MPKQNSEMWVIRIGGDYGSFLFEGTEEEAEQRRKDKARWEGAIGLKRSADESEIASSKASYCLNHKNFRHYAKGIKFNCDCGVCA